MPNQYKNKVIYGNSVLMDITDTTAEAGDVASGAVFYAKNGARTVGTFVQAQSDWDENDTTDPAYVLNRTHSRTSIGNYYQLDLINAYNSKYASTETIEPIGKTYTYYHFIDGIGHPYLLGFDEIDTTATSAKLIVNDIENNLSCLYSETVEDYDKVFYCYNNDFCIAVYLDEDSYSYEAYGYFYTNIDIDVSSIIFYLPSLAEQYTYNKLDNNYLNGLLITKGNGAGAEIFNAQNVRNSSTANGSYAHAEGANTHANGIDSHTEGYSTTADGSSSHAEGSSTYAYGSNSHSEGQHTRAIGAWSHAEGSGDFLNIYLTGEAGATTYTVSRTLIDSENKIQGSLINDDDHWRIVNVTATNDVIQTITLSETLSDTAISDERYHIYIGSVAFGQSSHAEGNRTTASGMFSHSEGGNTIAKGSFGAHAEGYCTKAYSNYQHVQGRYNIADSNNTYADIVGNGTTNNKRSNAYTLDWSGNGWFAGKVTVGAAPTNNMDVATKQYVDGAISSSAITVDAYLDGSSTNPVENSAITNELATKVSKDDGAVVVLLSLNGTTVTLDNSILQAYFKLNNATTTYFAISLSENNVIPMQISNVDMVNGTIALYTIIGNLKYSTTLTQVSGANQMTGTLVTETIASVSDIPSASSTTPLSDGTAAVGTSTAYARADHVHPKITQPIDSALSTTSENPVQNKVIQSALLHKLDVNANYSPIPLDFPDPENPPSILDGATVTCGLGFANIFELYQLAVDTSFELGLDIQNFNVITFHPFRIDDTSESIELFSIFDNTIYTITLEPNTVGGMVGTLHVDAIPDSVTVDSALSSASENPVQNKVIKSALDGKVNTVSGKGLSTNDYTTAEKNKLAGIQAGAQVNPTIDTVMSSSSTNPVTNSAITTAIANNRGKVFYGVVDNTSTATAFTAQIPGITAYEEGLVVILKNGVVTSASGFTININGLGALPAYNNLGAESRETTIFNVAYTMMFVYENRVSGGDWLCYRGYDANTNTIGYQLRTNSMSLPMKSVTYRYRLLFTSADGAHFVPANNTTSTNATASRAVCQDKIDPFRPIYYYGTTASVAANSRPSATYLWEQYTVSLGYSFNRTGAALTLSSWKPVYVKCAPQADGSAIMDATTPYVQDLPTTADGKIYIFLGVAYSATNIELVPHHPVYCYRNGGIQEWTGVQAEIDALTARINNLIDGDEVSY